jgi:hypothetical protein
MGDFFGALLIHGSARRIRREQNRKIKAACSRAWASIFLTPLTLALIEYWL